jgi:hypothetical protein
MTPTPQNERAATIEAFITLAAKALESGIACVQRTHPEHLDALLDGNAAVMARYRRDASDPERRLG